MAEISNVKIIYQDTAPGAMEATTPAQTDLQDFSDLADLKVENIQVPQVATLEDDYWVLGTAFKLFPDSPAGKHLGLWSKSQSQADRTFATPPTLILVLDALYSSVGISMTFDQYGPTWCDDLIITWLRDDTILANEEFYPDSYMYSCIKEVKNFNKVIIRFKRMTAAYRYMKLSALAYGIIRVFAKDERFSLSIYQAASPISEDVEAATMEVSLRNKTAIPFLFQRKQPLKVMDGAELLGVYFISTSKRTGSNAYTLACSDKLALLSEMGDHKGGVYTETPAGDLISDIMGGMDYELDDALKTVPLSGYLPAAARLDNLGQVAFALGAVVDTARSTAIRIFAPASGVTEIYDASHRYSDGASIERRALITEVRVTAHTYTAGTKTEQVYKGTLTGTLNLEFSSPMCALAITGGTISAWGHNWATIVGTGAAVELTGTKFEHATQVTTLRNPLVNAGDLEKIKEVKGCTLVSPTNVAEVARRVYDYYLKRDTATLPVLPGAARPGDLVQVDTDFEGTRQGVMVSMDWTGSNVLSAKAEIILDYDGEGAEPV